MKKNMFLLTVCVFFLFSYQKPVAFFSKHFFIKPLSPGVWAVINNDSNGHAICNAGIIDIGNKTIVFDPLMNIDAAEDLRKAAMSLTGRPATIVINSHFHNDHIRGNQVFVPGASIISSEWTKNEMSISEPEEIAWEKQHAAGTLARLREKLKTAKEEQRNELQMWIGYYEGMTVSDPILKTTLPDITFCDSLWIYGTKTDIRLIECRNGHTASDVILELPKQGIIFMGDLLFVERHPWFGDGNVESWHHHLLKLVSDTMYSVYVPGHGPVGGKKEIASILSYFEDTKKIVQNSIRENKPDSVIVTTAIPDAYKNWLFSNFYGGNLAFLCSQLRKND
jgi:cyclase